MTETVNIHGTDGHCLTEVLPKFADHSINGVWGHTYFVRRGDRIKIGHSAVPKQRLSSLGKPMTVLAVVPNTIIGEGDAHKRFARLRVEGEWFQAAPELLAFIDQVKREAADMPKREPPEINPEHKDTRRRLIALRAKYGADTAIGHRCSNIEAMLRNGVPPEKITKQMAELEQLLRDAQ